VACIAPSYSRPVHFPIAAANVRPSTRRYRRIHRNRTGCSRPFRPPPGSRPVARGSYRETPTKSHLGTPDRPRRLGRNRRASLWTTRHSALEPAPLRRRARRFSPSSSRSSREAGASPRSIGLWRRVTPHALRHVLARTAASRADSPADRPAREPIAQSPTAKRTDSLPHHRPNTESALQPSAWPCRWIRAPFGPTAGAGILPTPPKDPSVCRTGRRLRFWGSFCKPPVRGCKISTG
jgi:hypothetical protein